MSAEHKFGRTFVGRDTHLQHLLTAFEAAEDGHGSFVMVAGEPGIGKTTLCQRLITLVSQRGGRALVGHRYEEGSLAFPYLPFVEALHGYTASLDPDSLRRALRGTSDAVLRLLPEIRQRLHVPAPILGDPEEERYRLLQGVADFLQQASATHAMLLVLEDLHDADRGTLGLLTHLSRNLAGSRILTIGTYRDVEVNRAHPLAGTLAELRRAPASDRLLLRGLSPGEVQQMMDALTGQQVRRTLVEAVHRQTEGNPLFVEEVLRYLAEAGHVSHLEGRWRRTDSQSAEQSIPEGLRDVIGKRLSKLSQVCDQMLSIAAVIGREFQLDVLEGVVTLSDEDLARALAEARSAGIIEEETSAAQVRYRFTHALFRQALYEEMIAPRRNRLHREVARIIEQVYARHLLDHAAALAEHFSHSSDASDLAKAIDYGVVAAQQAVAIYGYGDAARLYEWAIHAQEALEPNDKARLCDLWLALGAVQMPAGEPRRAADIAAPEAFARAVELDDAGRVGQACRLALEALHRESQANIGQPEFEAWAQRATLWALDGTADRAYADIAMGRVLWRARRMEGIALLSRALALARQLDDSELLFTAAWQNLRVLMEHNFESAFALASEFIGRLRVGVSHRTQGQILEFCGQALLCGGDRDRAEAAFRELSALAGRTMDTWIHINALSWQAVLAVLDGRLDDALTLRAEMIALADESGSAGGFPLRGTSRALILRGQPEEVVSAGESYGLIALAHAGRRAEATVGLKATLAGRLAADGTLDPGAIRADSIRLFEAAAVIEDRATISLLLPILDRFPPLDPIILTCVPRWMGLVAAREHDWKTARSHYGYALELCGRIRYRPEIALINLELAELALDQAVEVGRPRDQSLQLEATEHLAFALNEFRNMGMDLALERASTLQNRIAPRPPAKARYPGGLTVREVEVLRLIAAGKTNQDIANELVISINTVIRHVRNIFVKIGASHRSEAATYATRNGLIS